MRSFTLADLRTKTLRRADMEVSRFVTAEEVNEYISAAYTELYEHLVHSGQHFFEKTQTIITIAGQAAYPLPGDFYSSIGVDWKIDNQRWVALFRLMMQERNSYFNTSSRALAYRMVANNLTFYPQPPANQTYRHLYVPMAPDLTADTDTIDGVSGWEELVVIDAAIKCLRKEESDTSALERERGELRGRLMASMEDRDLDNTHHVVDVESFDERSLRQFDPADWRYWK